MIDFNLERSQFCVDSSIERCAVYLFKIFNCNIKIDFEKVIDEKSLATFFVCYPVCMCTYDCVYVCVAVCNLVFISHSSKIDRGFEDSNPWVIRCHCQGVPIKCRVAHRYPPWFLSDFKLRWLPGIHCFLRNHVYFHLQDLQDPILVICEQNQKNIFFRKWRPFRIFGRILHRIQREMHKFCPKIFNF